MAWLQKKTWVSGTAYTVRSTKLGSRHLGIVPEYEADAARLEIAAQEKRFKAGQNVPRLSGEAPKINAATLFRDFVPEYLRWKETARPRSWEKVANHLNHAVKWFGHLPVDDSIEIKDEWAKQFIIYQRERIAGIDPDSPKRVHPCIPSSLICEWSDIRAALYRAARTGGARKGNRWNLCNSSPIAELYIDSGDAEGEREIHTFTPDELQAICEVEPEMAPIWQFVVNTGLRQTEAAMQLQAYVDLGVDKPQCRLVHNPKKGLHLKGKRQRAIPLNPGAQEARDRIIFNRRDDERFMIPQSRSWWTHHFVHNARMAGVEEGTFNSLRHTFISRGANSGNIPIDVVRRWAGHAYLKTTQRYLHVLPDVEHEYAKLLKI